MSQTAHTSWWKVVNGKGERTFDQSTRKFENCFNVAACRNHLHNVKTEKFNLSHFEIMKDYSNNKLKLTLPISKPAFFCLSPCLAELTHQASFLKSKLLASSTLPAIAPQ